MSRLIVWRHGETAWNAARRVQGHADVELSQTGRDQAVAAAERLAGLNPVAIVASDLVRAVDTAAALSAVTGLPVRRDPRLRERYYGPWQGRSLSEIAERWPAEYARWRGGEPVLGLGIETLDDLAKRVAAAFADAAALADVDAPVSGAEGSAEVDAPTGGPPGAGAPPAGVGGDPVTVRASRSVVVVATHGGAARHGCAALLGWPERVTRTLGGLGNCRWTELRADPDRGWQLWSHNAG